MGGVTLNVLVEPQFPTYRTSEYFYYLGERYMLSGASGPPGA
jgi:hypothetical protein